MTKLIDNENPRREYKCGCITHYKKQTSTTILCENHTKIELLEKEINELKNKSDNRTIIKDYYREVETK